MNSEVLIIGGGVIGLGIARELHLRGIREITVLEKGVCGEESSWAAAGMLGPQAEADEAGPFFDLCIGSRDLYPTFADDLLAETGIDIELDRSGTLYAAFTDEDVASSEFTFRLAKTSRTYARTIDRRGNAKSRTIYLTRRPDEFVFPVRLAGRKP